MPQHPIQNLAYLPGSGSTIIASSGSRLFLLDTASGAVTWHDTPSEMSIVSTTDRTDASSPPSKRRRLDPTTSPAPDSDASVEIDVGRDRVKGERRKPRPPPPTPVPATVSFICISPHFGGASSSNNNSSENPNWIAVATSEDKAICVFSVENTTGDDGSESNPSEPSLILRSRRTMPKRVCALTVSPRGRKLLVGDKFGDVYEIPVWPAALPPDSSAVSVGEKNNTAQQQQQDAAPQPSFTPSASETTVHTKRNLLALKQQQQLKLAASSSKKSKDATGGGGGAGLGFQGRCILGHVSLLTDVAVARISSSTSGGEQQDRTYILTSDRDEHVRISRYPQSHVIEGYCLGLREFVSVLSVLPWDQSLVAVGSGEPSVRIYRWGAGELRCEEAFAGSVRDEVESGFAADDASAGGLGSEKREFTKLAVSGIWPVEGYVLVALEG
jgi:hypothetical protein